KVRIHNLTISLAIEKTYIATRFKEILYDINPPYMKEEYLERMNIDNHTSITKRNNELYLLEIEINNKVDTKYINTQLNKYALHNNWPCIKPIEIKYKKLSKIIQNNDVLFSHKCDGYHGIVLYKDMQWKFVYDNGDYINLEINNSDEYTSFIFECEY